jgi:UDP-N-acetylglucosamine 2-epimerase (non-hydrolysing)
VERSGRLVRPLLVALGTRPEAIKLAPVVAALRVRGVPTFVLSTGQHRELLAPILDVFALTPDRDLAVMRPGQSLAALSAAILAAIDPLLAELAPRRLVVQGDTSTVAAAALAAFYRRVPVAHVEAGLRTGDRHDPFPEEMNRTLLGDLADLHFAPTPRARENLLREGVADGAIHVVGNTVIDALQLIQRRVAGRSLADFDLPEPAGRRLVVVTGHRRENFGAGFAGVFAGLRRIADEFADSALLVYPLHLNPEVREPALERLAGVANLKLIEPLDYLRFVRLLIAADLIVTDSGGVQEEATALGVPVLVTRRTSERLEAVEAGVAELVGTDPERIAAAARRLLTDSVHRAARAVASAVFGDGRAGERIAEVLAPEGEEALR